MWSRLENIFYSNRYLKFFFFLKAIKKCQTTNEPGSKVKNAPCKFPFTNNGKKYDSCTTDSDPDGRFWCSTKVDQSGNHQTGNWGYCSQKCYDYFLGRFIADCTILNIIYINIFIVNMVLIMIIFFM